MPTSRLEAFSDGVLAIIITIMVLALPVPEGETFGDLWRTTGPGLLTYVLSFVYVGIYWNNHHHLLHAVHQVTGAALWANLHLLFWLSLLPLATAWMDSTALARAPVLAYGVVLLACAGAFFVLQSRLLRAEGPDSAFARTLEADAAGTTRKDRISLAGYLVGIVAVLLDARAVPSPVGVTIALVAYVAVALVWLVPDRRFESVVRRR